MVSWPRNIHANCKPRGKRKYRNGSASKCSVLWCSSGHAKVRIRNFTLSFSNLTFRLCKKTKKLFFVDFLQGTTSQLCCNINTKWTVETNFQHDDVFARLGFSLLLSLLHHLGIYSVLVTLISHLLGL